MEPESGLKELNAFLSTNRILGVERQFVSDGPRSYWSFCVSFSEIAQGMGAKAKSSSQPRLDYREILSEEDFTVYSKLRTLRKELAEKEGVPPYAVF